jgi:four helix bundle protein
MESIARKSKPRGFKDLIVFQKAYSTAMTIFVHSKKFPKEETYSLTDQIRRASRSVCANIAESYRKRLYPKSFVAKLTDADAECSETLVFLCFALDCGYLEKIEFDKLESSYEEIGRMLGAMIQAPQRFLASNS